MSADSLFEWRFEEEPPQPRAEEDLPPPRTHGRLRWLFLSLGILIALTALLLASRYWQGRNALRRDLQAHLDRERQAIAAGDAPILRTLLDPSASDLWQGWRTLEWKHLAGNDLPLRAQEVILLEPNLALVAVEGWPLFRGRVRLYRRVGGQWVWSLPRSEDWGPLLPPLDLPCARVQARTRDDNTLQYLAQREESLCAALRDLLSSNQKADLILAPDQEMPEVDFLAHQLVLPSPWFLTLDPRGQGDALIALLRQIAQARQGIEHALTLEAQAWDDPFPYIVSQKTTANNDEQRSQNVVRHRGLTQEMRLAFLRFTPEQVLVHVQLKGQDGGPREEFEAWWIFQRKQGQWQRSPGTALMWGPWLRRSDNCVTLTYRAIDRAWVTEAWPLITRMCRRGRDAFGVPTRPGALHIVLAPDMAAPNTLKGDVVVPSPVTWPSPVRQPLSLRLARSVATHSVPYFLHLNASRSVPPLLQGLTLTYLLPETAWLEEDQQRFRRLAETGALAAYTQPDRWENLPEDVLARSLARYMLEQWGLEGLRVWLSLLPRTSVDPEVLDSSIRLTAGVSFATFLQAWYLDTDPTLQAREMWLPRLRAALMDVVHTLGPASRVYVYAGGRPTLPGGKRPGIPWRALEGEILGVPVNVRANVLSSANARARPDALHVQFFLPHAADIDLEATVMYHGADAQVRTVRLRYRFVRREEQWIAVRVER